MMRVIVFSGSVIQQLRVLNGQIHIIHKTYGVLVHSLRTQAIDSQPNKPQK